MLLLFFFLNQIYFGSLPSKSPFLATQCEGVTSIVCRWCVVRVRVVVVVVVVVGYSSRRSLFSAISSDGRVSVCVCAWGVYAYLFM